MHDLLGVSVRVMGILVIGVAVAREAGVTFGKKFRDLF